MDRNTAEPDVKSLPGDRAQRWIEYHQQRAATSTFVYEFIWDVTAPAIGPFCMDIDGNVLLDFASHVAASPLGYNNPKITEPLSEFDAIDPMKIAGQDFYASTGWPPENPSFPGPTQLLDRLIEITDHYDMDTVFLSNSGAEAVENAIKICYNRFDGKHGITFAGGFHGRTLGALSSNRSKAVHRRGFPEIAGIESVPFCENRHCDATTCSCGFFVGPQANETESGVSLSGESTSRITSSLRRMLDPSRGNVDASDVSYLIVEPIQGEGGYRIPSQSFMTEIADVTEEYDIPVVADEIQTGLGRTGEMWGVDHYAIEPDVITSAKALRVGATISRDELFPDTPGRISTTWGGGDILASLRGVLTIDAIQEYDLLSNARERGRQFKERLREEVPSFVVDVRGKGLMLAVEFDSKPRRDAAVCEAFSRGLLTLGCGYRTMRVLPPLDVTAREIDLGVDLLLETLEDQQVKDVSPDHPGADDVI
jgi:4-aminobutyrate aminotransferase